MSRELTKQELRRPDEFVGFFEKRLYQFENRKKHIFWASIGILFIVGIGFFVQSIRDNKNQKAAVAFATVMDKLPSNLSKETGDWKTFLDETDQFLTKYKSTQLASIAYLYKGKAQFSLRQYPEALVSYQKASKELKPPYQYLAQEGQAITQMELTQWDLAQKTWQGLVAKQDNPVRDFHLYNLGLVQEKLGQMDQSKQTFTTLQNDFPESPYTATAKLKVSNTTAK